MTSFTSHSKATHLAQALFAGFTFGLMFILGFWLKPYLERGRPPVLATLADPPWPGHYLAYNGINLDEIILFYNLAGSMEAARKADILCLGNSRLQYAFRKKSIQALAEKVGMRVFSLSLAGEGAPFTMKVLRKYDLRPNWVIVNADSFLGSETSNLGEKLLRKSKFDGWKMVLDGVCTFDAQRWLHRRVPYLSPTQFRGPQWVVYRDWLDGTIQVAASWGKAGPVQDDESSGGRATPEDVKVAAQVIDELRSRGAKVVLICIPPSVPLLARAVAQECHVPLIRPEVADLMTIDESHLDQSSADRYGQAVLDELVPLITQSKKR